MTIYVAVSLAGGVLFGVMDAVIHGNPLARRLFEIYEPIARKSVNAVAGTLIDLAYGFGMAGIYVVLYPSLPGTGVTKGVSFALIAWFFRVAMQAASQWVMFRVPARTLAYSLVTGLVEMLVLGTLYGLVLKPWW